jgi:hypothetical protein
MHANVLNFHGRGNDVLGGSAEVSLPAVLFCFFISNRI